jgi:two-component system response regulator CpxR
MSASKILIVDDDARTARMLVELLADEGFDPAHEPRGAATLARLPGRSCDLVILDVEAGNRDGFELLRRLRMQEPVPVLMLTARGGKTDGILGLELGADDYLSKPFSPRELIARLRAILRRAGPNRGIDSTPLTLGGLTIDLAARSATMEGVPVRLTTAEFMLLEILVRSAGRVQSRAALTSRALGRRLEPYDRCIDTHISNIRRKLCLDVRRGLEIKSSRGRGYVLTVARRRL